MKPTTLYDRRYSGTGAAHNQIIWSTDIGDLLTTELAPVIGVTPNVLMQRWRYHGNKPEKLFMAPQRRR